LSDDVRKILGDIDYTNKELVQEIFMNIGSKYTKFKLDQFYSPLTLSQFICSFMKDAAENTAVDPAGGTGDLLLYYGGVKHIWDIDESAVVRVQLRVE
jgi:ubiquinone/menaquinone biosynthesis C-methylase UbiE